MERVILKRGRWEFVETAHGYKVIDTENYLEDWPIYHIHSGSVVYSYPRLVPKMVQVEILKFYKKLYKPKP